MKEFAGLAARIGQGLAKRQWPLVYGGGDVGLMGTVADAVMANGGTVHGFIPERLMELEVGKQDISTLEITADMFVRKRAMIEQSKAYIALPGGLGTIDEIMDVITLKQLGYHTKPMILVGQPDFWQPFKAMIDHVISNKFASPSAADLYDIVGDETRLWELTEQAATC